jgi:3-oxoacyl-[acyl-carrier-protein] synthase III
VPETVAAARKESFTGSDPVKQALHALSPRSASVLGCGTALPERVVETAELAPRFGVDADWAIGRTGVRRRRIADPDARLTDLAADASRAALDRAELEAAELDLVLVATVTADEITPSAAPLVAHAIGAVGAGAADVGAACTGFLTALSLAAAQIESGRAQHVLVVGADILSRITDPEDRATAMLFADGAGAVVLGASGDGGGLGPVLLRHDGTGARNIIAPRARGLIEMDGQETYRNAVARLTEASREAADAAGIALEDVDLFIPHQANARITRAVGARLGLPDSRVVDCIGELGNTSAATLPLALAHAEKQGRLRPGDTVLLAAFGAGFTWGAGVLEWGRAA